MEPFLERLDRRVVVGDGAMGTELYAKGIPFTACFDHLNVTQPELVASIHREYLAAGAELIETNTFGANRLRLAPFGLETDVVEINREGARLAKREAGGKAYVAGSVGPLVVGWGPEQETPAGQVRELYREQIAALVEGGIDVLILETFSSLDHLLAALAVAREVKKDLPVVCQMSFLDAERTASGVWAVTAAKALEAAGADVVGTNCVSGPIWTLKAVETMAGACSARLSAFPNAGAPAFVNGRYMYLSNPKYFAEYVLKMVEQGVSLIGGCCGTNAADIRAIAGLLGTDRKPRARPAPVRFAEPIETAKETVESIPTGPPKDGFLRHLGKKKIVTVEIDPPKGLDIAKAVETSKLLARDGGVDLINLAENTLGIPRLSNIALAHILQRETGIETLVHITGRDRNLIGLQSALMGTWALGIRNILAITGDPASIGAQPGASSVYDTQSFGLVELIGKMNRGTNALGGPIGKRTAFTVAVAFDPNGKRMEPQINRLRKKVRLGAHAALTQPVYSAAVAREMVQKTADVGIPILLGVMPLASERNAEYLHNEVPGISIPDEIRAQMKGLSGKAGKKKGLELARQIVEELYPRVPGFYIIPMFNDPEIALEMVQCVRALEAKQAVKT